MKKNAFKKSMAFLAAAVMAVGITAIGSAITKADNLTDDTRNIIGTKISFDKNEVDGGDLIKVSVQFVDTMNREVPLEVEVTRGAVIAVDTAADIEFKSNGKVTSFTNVDVNDDANIMELLTNPVVRNKSSVFSFYVEAPIDAGDFQVIVTNDSPNETLRKTISQKVKVTSGLTMEIPEVLNDVDKFDVTGLATYKGQEPSASSYMFMEMVSVDPDQPYFYEIQLDAEISKGTYAFNSIQLPSDYEDGEYYIKVYLFDGDLMQVVGFVERKVTFAKKPNVLQKSIYAQQRGIYFTINDPADDEGVTYKKLLVYPAIGWWVPNDFHGNHNIQSKVVLKSAKEAAAAKNAKFVVTSSFPTQEFPAVKSGTSFIGALEPLRLQQTVVVNGVTRRPFVELVYTNANNEEVRIYVGDLEAILDPSGHVTDSETKLPIKDATVTLFRLDEETENWIEWNDETGKQVNPQITNADGIFAWDVEDGSYEVRVYHPDYHQEGEYYTTLFDPKFGPINVPPERDDVYIVLTKPQA